MQYFITLLGLCLISFSCNKANKQRAQITTNQENIKIEKSITSKIDTVLTKQDLIQGIWAQGEEDNALFYIEDSSFYYVEAPNNALPCQLLGDTLFVKGDMLIKYYIKRLTNDSLWYENDFYDGITKLYKRK